MGRQVLMLSSGNNLPCTEDSDCPQCFAPEICGAIYIGATVLPERYLYRAL